MPSLSNTAVILLVAAGAFLVIAKILKAEKVAAVLGLIVIVVWFSLYLTGYDKSLRRILFEAPPIQHARPEDLRNR